ncbi:MAG: DUF58 domain-containing protein [Bacteroidota bacterium]|jgi:uncharacterized protein (DUF58 family)
MPELSEDLLLQTPLELLATQVVEGFITGMHKSPFHGFSVEFAEHRLYNTGESTRHIDWKLFGRTDKLFVKRYEEETNLRCQIIIDNSGSMYYPEKGLNKIRFSVYAAASIIHLLKKQRDASGLSIINNDIAFHVQPKLQSAHQKLMMHELEKLLKKPESPRQSLIVNALHKLAERIHRRSLVVLFSDMFDSAANMDKLFEALQHLKFNKHEVILFHVTDKRTEMEFDFQNRPYIFIDSETNEKVKLFPSQIKEKYQSELSRFNHELKLKCAQFKIDLFEASVSNDFNQLLTAFLVKRTKMY